MTEKERMLAGELYDPLDEELVAERKRARLLFQKINSLHDDEKEQRDQLLYELFGKAGNGLWIEPPFFCDYGSNIEVGENVFMNFNTCILDVCKVTIGSRTMLAPNVSILTATHPLEAKPRSSGRELGKPITIGEDVWIGGGAVLNPGISIGNSVVIGSGAVVTKSFGDHVFIAGNPARVIREIEN